MQQAFWEGRTLCTGIRQTADRDDTIAGNANIDVRMKVQLLFPGVQDRKDAGSRPREPFVSTESKQCLMNTSEPMSFT